MRLGTIRKALAPAILSVWAIGGQWIATGKLDVAELSTGVAGIVTAVVVYLLPNDDA